MTSPTDLYREAMQAYQANDRDRARDLLLEVVTITPDHEKSWLWLSDLLDDRSERITALQNALLLNPNRPQTRQRLDAIKQEQQAEWEARYQTAVSTATNDPIAARDILLKLVHDNPRHTAAWLLLATHMPETKDKIVALQNVLDLNPDHQAAQQQLDYLQRHRDNPLALAASHQRNGNHNQARHAYMQAYQQAETATARATITRKLEELERQSASGHGRINPTQTILRLITGPIVLYLLLIFIQMGLGVNRWLPVYLIGAVAVAAGSALTMALQNAPAHPLLVKWTGEPEERPYSLRVFLWSLSLTAMLLPFALLLLRGAIQTANLTITLPQF